MLNYFLKLKRKKGFTLVELIVVVAILAILMACIAAFSGPIRQMVNRTSSSSDSIAANALLGNYIENRLSFAQYIEMYCAINPNAASGTASVNGTFDSLKGWLNDANANANDKAGVLIFHYVEDTNNPEDSHYELYDVPITKTSASFNAAVFDGTDFREENAVFAEDFYSFGNNLFIFPTEPSINKVRGDAFMSVDIIPYNFFADLLVYDGDTLDSTVKQSISSSTVSDYYKYKFNRDQELATGTVTVYTDETCTLGALDKFRAGPKETITFELQNITMVRKVGVADTEVGPEDSGIDDRFKVANCAEPGSSSITGTDIMVFYYTPHF